MRFSARQARRPDTASKTIFVRGGCEKTEVASVAPKANMKPAQKKGAGRPRALGGTKDTVWEGGPCLGSRQEGDRAQRHLIEGGVRGTGTGTSWKCANLSHPD